MDILIHNVDLIIQKQRHNYTKANMVSASVIKKRQTSRENDQNVVANTNAVFKHFVFLCWMQFTGESKTIIPTMITICSVIYKRAKYQSWPSAEYL